MKAVYHPNSIETEEVEILDIFVDRDGRPKMLFVRTDGRVLTAPIGRFTEMHNGHKPVKKARRLPDEPAQDAG